MDLTGRLRRWWLLRIPLRSLEGKPERDFVLLWRLLASEGWYNPASRRVSSVVGESVQAINTALEPFRSVMSGAKGQEDPLRVLCPRLLDGLFRDIGIAEADLEFDRNRLKARDEESNDLRHMDGRFSSTLGRIPKKKIASWDGAAGSLRSLAGLSEFDFDDLVSLWDLQSNKGKGPYVDTVAERLQDLYFLAAAIRVDDALMSMVRTIDPFFETDQAVALSNAISEFTAKRRMEDLIRVGFDDAGVQIRIAESSGTPFRNAIQAHVDSYKSERQKYARWLEAEDMKMRMLKLFGDSELQLFHLYNAPTSTLLIEKRFAPFLYDKQIHLLHNYRLLVVEPRLKPFISEFLLEVDFADRDGQKQFNEAVDKAYAATYLIEQFEQDLRSDSHTKLASVVSKTEALPPGPNIRAVVRKEIDDTNKWADEICRQSLSAYGDLHFILETILKDADAPNPSIVLTGGLLRKRQEALFSALQENVESLAGVLAILRMYVVVTNAEEPQR